MYGTGMVIDNAEGATEMSDRPKKCSKCGAGSLYLLQEHLGRLQIFSCRRGGSTAFVSPGQPPSAKADRARLGQHRSLSGKTAGELRLERSAQADLLDHEAANALAAEGPGRTPWRQSE